MFSSFKLADGYVTALDLFSMSCKTNMVALSGCQSGLAEVSGSDDLLGLVRGFLYAGARSLLLSLWSVNDESTALLMGEFYKAWQGGENRAKALQTAIRNVRRDSSRIRFIGRRSFWLGRCRRSLFANCCGRIRAHRPSWPGGVDATSRTNIAKLPLMAADGVVVQDHTEIVLNLNHHPVCAASDASHFLLTRAATPPGQEGRWPGPPTYPDRLSPL